MMSVNSYIPNTTEHSRELQVYSNMQSPAVLILIAPQREIPLGNFAHRPAVFNFSDSFVSSVSDTLQECKETAKDTPLKRFLQSPEYRHAIVPSARPDCSVNLTPFGEKWRFLLVLKNPPRHITNASMPTSNSSLVDCRVSLSGYVEGEPISPNGAFNYKAVLKIMHKSIQQQQTAHSPIGAVNYGPERMVYHTQVVDSSLPHFTTTHQPLHLLTLNACHNNLEKSHNGFMTFEPSPSQQIGTPDNYGEEGGLILDYKNSDPYSSLKRLMNNLYYRQMDTVMAHQDNFQYSVEQRKEDFKTAIDSSIPNDQRVRQGTAQSMLGYHENQYITLGDVDKAYHVEVHVINNNNIGGVDTVDQHGANMRNIFGSLIHETLISKMSKYGIGHITFQYESQFEKANDEFSVGNPYAVDIRGEIHSLYERPHEETYQQALMMIHELSQEVFKSMAEANGDFSLCVSSSLMGLTYIQLNFFCDHQFIHEPLMFPTYFSGLITQKWGTGDYARVNNENYCKWIDTITTNYAYGKRKDDVWERPDDHNIYQQFSSPDTPTVSDSVWH